jgi:TonB family protein
MAGVARCAQIVMASRRRGRAASRRARRRVSQEANPLFLEEEISYMSRMHLAPLTAAAAAAALTATTPLLAAPALAAQSSLSATFPSCVGQRGEPRVIHRELPSIVSARLQRHAIVAVTVSRSGLVRDARLVRSSGNGRFDTAALAAARATAFSPASRDCVAIDSTVRYALGVSASGARETAVVRNSTVEIVATQR